MKPRGGCGKKGFIYVVSSRCCFSRTLHELRFSSTVSGTKVEDPPRVIRGHMVVEGIVSVGLLRNTRCSAVRQTEGRKGELPTYLLEPEGLFWACTFAAPALGRMYSNWAFSC